MIYRVKLLGIEINSIPNHNNNGTMAKTYFSSLLYINNIAEIIKI